ncbi:MAG TPA: Nif3-like dinuclear metal center hexameric protein, partial [Pilimelia sp.]|nr:Nif3-like dinuclear metal center hexameric protein [Pilimelia sp.]
VPAGPDDPAAGQGRGIGRIGHLPTPMTLAELTAYAARVLPPTAWGVRAAGEPDRLVRTVAVSGGAGDSYLADAERAGVDAYLTADLRHHPVSEHLAGGGPALLDAAHWATERPWLDDVAAHLAAALPVTATASDLVTDPWTVHHASPPLKETP